MFCLSRDVQWRRQFSPIVRMMKVFLNKLSRYLFFFFSFSFFFFYMDCHCVLLLSKVYMTVLPFNMFTVSKNRNFFKVIKASTFVLK